MGKFCGKIVWENSLVLHTAVMNIHDRKYVQHSMYIMFTLLLLTVNYFHFISPSYYPRQNPLCDMCILFRVSAGGVVYGSLLGGLPRSHGE